MTLLPDGLYDRILDSTLREAAKSLEASGQADIEKLAPAERRRRLVGEIAKLLPELLDAAANPNEDGESELRELAFLNQLLTSVRRNETHTPPWTAPVLALRSVHRTGAAPIFPSTGLSSPWLFTAGRADPSLFAELRAELSAADRVDILVSFITWSGIRKLWDVLESVTAVGANGQPRTRIRVITTTYTGATDARAVEALAKLPGVDVRISLDGRRSRLHAKAWLFQRATGFGSAFVGSANLSAAALLGGIEWTVKFTRTGQGDLFAVAEAHFETLWNDPEFLAFDARDEQQCERLRVALGEARHPTQGTDVPGLFTWFDLRPKAFQQAMLERLAAERRHGRTRNLLVAATGTGKTVVAAFDYKRVADELGSPPCLLFVAHRIEILTQAMATFRQILRRPDFGDLLADGQHPNTSDHLFATIQSVTAARLVETCGPDHWHMVIVDECHHLPATSFASFAREIQPKIFLGLTATPERTDGAPIAEFFQSRPDGSPAVELRLWDALDQQLLAPFEYYASQDETDFRNVPWGNTAAETARLSQILTGDHARARLVATALERYVADIGAMRAIAFCVDIEHTKFMAAYFNEKGLPALSVTSQTPRVQRERAPAMLASREVKIICTCDLYNEGIDIPEANTILFLRPTQSPVIFQQQLGRGLRLADGKECCLVLDFVGRLQEGFRFDRLYQAITGLSRRQLMQELQEGFTSLPPGCHIQFDKVARQRVLDSLREIANQTWRRLTAELCAFAAGRNREEISLALFLREQCVELEDVYHSRGWIALRRAAGLEQREIGIDENYLGAHFQALLHVNDPARLNVFALVATEGSACWSRLDSVQRRTVQMLAYQVFSNRSELMDALGFLQRLDRSPLMREELCELSAYLDDRTDLEAVQCPDLPDQWPLTLHAAYSRREILTAVGWMDATRRPPSQSGVVALHDEKIEILLVTLDKKEGFHERVAYHDYAVSPEIFHWQTQNTAGPNTPVGRRYCESSTNGWRFQLFVRETRDDPYIALGPVSLEGEPTGDHPMSITWRLQVHIPLSLFRRFSVLRN
jgi:superfamily II DNA or RNA helicase/HKD family nuclease